MKYDVVGYEDMVPTRFEDDTVKMIKRIIRKDPETYGSISHFVRAATLKRIREEKTRLKI